MPDGRATRRTKGSPRPVTAAPSALYGAATSQPECSPSSLLPGVPRHAAANRSRESCCAAACALGAGVGSRLPSWTNRLVNAQHRTYPRSPGSVSRLWAWLVLAHYVTVAYIKPGSTTSRTYLPCRVPDDGRGSDEVTGLGGRWSTAPSLRSRSSRCRPTEGLRFRARLDTVCGGCRPHTTPCSFRRARVPAAD